MTHGHDPIMTDGTAQTPPEQDPDANRARRGKHSRKIAAIAVFFVFVFCVWQFGLRHLLSLDSIQHYAASLSQYTAAHRPTAMAVFFVVYIVLLCLFVPVATLFDLLGGFLFGAWTGGWLILAAATTGASLIFLTTRSVLGVGLRERAGPLYTSAVKEIHSGAVFYLLFLRLVPGVPFALANVIPALLHIPFPTFLWTTAIGIAPITFIIANLGETLGSIHSLHDLYSPKLALALTLLGLLALIPVLLKKIKARRARKA